MVAFLNSVPHRTHIADLLARLLGYKVFEVPAKISAAADNITISNGKKCICCLDELPVMVSAGIYGAFRAKCR